MAPPQPLPTWAKPTQVDGSEYTRGHLGRSPAAGRQHCFHQLWLSVSVGVWEQRWFRSLLARSQRSVC